MKKNKLHFILLSLVCGILLFNPSTSYAEGVIQQCSSDVVDGVKEQYKNTAKQTTQSFLTALKNYNDAAQKFVNECDTKAARDKSTLYPSAKDLSAAKVLDIDISDPQLYINTNIDWTKEKSKTSFSDTCKSQLNNIDALYNAMASLKPVMSKSLSMTDGDCIECVCDENNNNPTCVSSCKEEKGETSDGCLPFGAYLDQFERCPICSLFNIILNTDAQIAHLSWNAVSGALIKIVATFFLVVIALDVLKMVASPTGTKTSALLKSILLNGLKVAIAVILLSNSSYIYGLFISPVLKGGLDMGMAIANSSGGSCTIVGESGITPTQEFDSSLFDAVIGSVKCFQTSAGTIPAMGRALICHSFADTLPKLSMWLSGAIMYLFGLMIWLAVSFYLIDCTVQLGMLSALVPLFIACWPFKMTQSYAYKGVKMIMNTFFNYFMVGVVLLIGIEITSFAATGKGTNLQEMQAALDNNDIKLLQKLTSLDSFQILILIACCIFSMKLIGTINSLANKFSSGAGSDIGNKFGGMLASGGKSVGFGALSLGKREVAAGAAAVADKTGLKSAVARAKGGIKKTWAKTWAGAEQAVGLGKFQNQQTGSGVTTSTTDNKDNQKNKNQNNQQNSDNNTGNNQNNNNTTDNQNSNQNSETSTQPNPDTEGTTYYDNGNVKSETSLDNDGNKTTKNYDENGRQTSESVTNKNGHQKNYAVDQPRPPLFRKPGDTDQITKRLTSESFTDKNGNSVVKNYDKNGKLDTETITDKEGNTTNNAYYKNGQLQSQIVDTKDGAKDVKQYYQNGNIAREYHSDKDGSIEMQYYENGQKEHERIHDKNTNSGHYEAFNQDGSQKFKNEWNNDENMA